MVPYGAYDITANGGRSTAASTRIPQGFAVIRGACRLGKFHYPQAKALTLTTDHGDSHDTSARPWKCELRRFVNETSVSITVVNLPPRTSKWNRIEHQMFAFISQNWRR